MSSQSWMECLIPGTGPGAGGGAGTLFNTYTTAKTVLPNNCLYDIPRNWWTIGKKLVVRAHVGISNRVTGPDTFTLQLMMTSTVAFTSSTINLTTTAHTTIPALITGEFTCRAVGTTGNVMGQWYVQGQMIAMAASLADGVANTGWAMGPNTAPAVGGNFDTTVSQTIDFWVAQSVSNAGNGIQVQQYELYASN
jgi:hypothetical protein